MSETTRERAIAAAERQVRYVRAIRWTDAAGNWDVEFAADRCVALADSEVAAAVLECRRDQQAAVEAALLAELARLSQAAFVCQPTDVVPLSWPLVAEWLNQEAATHTPAAVEGRAALAGEVNPE